MDGNLQVALSLSRKEAEQESGDDEFRRLLEEEGFTIKEVAADGNCFYAAISLALYGTADHMFMMRVRRSVFSEVYQRQNEFEIAGTVSDTFENQFADIMWEGKWAREVAVNAASTAVQSVIVLHKPDNPRGLSLINPGSFPHEIHLSHHNGNHFNLLEFSAARQEGPDVNELEDEIISSGSSVRPARRNQKRRRINSEEVVSDEESLPSSQTQSQSLDIEQTGIKFVLNKVVATSRNIAKVMLLVPKSDETESLEEILSGASRIPHIYLQIDYESALKMCLKDGYVEEDYDVYCNKVRVPLATEFHSRSRFLASLMIAPLILCAVNYKFNNIRVKYLFNYASNAMMSDLLASNWAECKEMVLQQVTTLLEEDSLFCYNCSSRCPHSKDPMHFAIKRFQLQKRLGRNGSGYFGRYNMWTNIRDVDLQVFCDIIALATSGGNVRVQDVVALLDENFSSSENLQHYSYLMMLMDGPKMRSGRELAELLRDADVRKAFYAGSCEGEKYRSSHFYDKNSSLYKALSSTSVLVLLRSLQCKDMWDAKRDEAIVIEKLKSRKNKEIEKEKNCSFVLLNIRSESSQLLGLSTDEINSIHEFGMADTPTYKTEDNDALAGFDSSPIFMGNLNVSHRIDIPNDGDYMNKTYSDVEEYWDEMNLRSSS